MSLTAFNYQFNYKNIIETDLSDSQAALFVVKAIQVLLLALPPSGTGEIIQAIKPILPRECT